MDTPMRKLFDPTVMPPRDEEGMCVHPDLQTEHWNRDDDEERYDLAKFAAAGFEVTFVEFEHDAPEELQDTWYNNDDANCSAWQPSTPNGEGWMLAGIWDSEDGPIAFYVREVVAA